MKACPNCKSKSYHRMKRRGFVKIIPGFIGYACDKCNQNYVWHSTFNFTIKVKY